MLRYGALGLLLLSTLAPSLAGAGPVRTFPMGAATVPSNAPFFVEYGGRNSGRGALVMDGPLEDTYLPERETFGDLVLYDFADSSSGTPPFVTVRADGEPRLTAMITFADEPDLQPPAKPTIAVREIHMEDQYGDPYASAAVSLVDPDPDAVAWVLFANGTVVQGSLFTSIRLYASINLGGESCYTAVVIDSAGNRSVHSEPYCAGQGGGCTTTAAHRRGDKTPWIAIVALLVIRRRRRATSYSVNPVGSPSPNA